jgi:hypothetical protein
MANLHGKVALVTGGSRWTYVVLPHDGFDILFGEEAGSTCFYAAPRFQCVVTGD